MQTFVGEFVCGGGFGQRPVGQIVPSLRSEGAAMLCAVATDLAEMGNVILPRDPRFPLELPDGVSAVDIDTTAPLWPQWIKIARDCDAAIVIAPEQDGMLAQAVAMLRAGGVDVVMSSGDFLRIASDKWETARLFASHQVPHPPTFSCDSPPDDSVAADRWVLKPRDGCGTDRIQTFDLLDDAKRELTERFILQTWIDGEPISVGVIVDGGQMTVLPAVMQEIDRARCAYAGGHGPLADRAQQRATSLASYALAAMPPFARGFIGLDLVLADDPADDTVIEINARLTTSYVGIRKMVDGNLARHLLGQGNGPVRCCVGEHAVRWTPDGQIWLNDEPVENP